MKEWVAVVIVSVVLVAAWGFLQQQATTSISKTLDRLGSVLGVWSESGWGVNPLFDDFDVVSITQEQIISAKKIFVQRKVEVSRTPDFEGKQAVLELLEINLVLIEELPLAKKIEEDRENLGSLLASEGVLFCSTKDLVEQLSSNVSGLLSLSKKRNKLVSQFLQEHPSQSEKIGLQRGFEGLAFLENLQTDIEELKEAIEKTC